MGLWDLVWLFESFTTCGKASAAEGSRKGCALLAQLASISVKLSNQDLFAKFLWNYALYMANRPTIPFLRAFQNPLHDVN